MKQRWLDFSIISACLSLGHNSITNSKLLLCAHVTYPNTSSIYVSMSCFVTRSFLEMLEREYLLVSRVSFETGIMFQVHSEIEKIDSQGQPLVFRNSTQYSKQS